MDDGVFNGPVKGEYLLEQCNSSSRSTPLISRVYLNVILIF